MAGSPPPLRVLFAELQRRRVFRVVAVYCAAAFVVLQLADIAFPALGLPDWTLTLVVVLALLGLPLSAAFAWVFETRPEGGIGRTAPATEEDLAAIASEPPSSRWPAGLLAAAGVVLLLAGAWWLGRVSVGTNPEGETADQAPRLSGEALAEQPSVVVLPFETIGGSSDEDRLLADGMHIEIQGQLATIRDLRVLSPFSARDYDSTAQSIQEIARGLAADYIVTGSARHDRSRARITARLIETRTGENLWVEQFETELTTEGLFDVQASTARRVADRLQVSFRPEDLDAAANAPRTHSAAALNAYYRALQAGNERDAESFLDDIQLAISLDSTFVDAWFILAMGRVLFVEILGHQASEARKTVERVEELAPGSIQARAVRAFYAGRIDGEVKRAVRDLEALAAEVPSNNDVLLPLANLQYEAGDLEAAASSYRRATFLDPRNAIAYPSLTDVLFELGRYRAARTVLERWLILEPSNRVARMYAVILAYDIDGPEAAESLARELQMDPGAPVEGDILVELAFAAGEYARADSLLALREPENRADAMERLATRGLMAMARGGRTDAIGDSLLATPYPAPGRRRVLLEGFGHLFVGDTGRAVARAREGAVLQGGDPYGTSMLAVALLAYSGAEDEAFAFLDEIVEAPGAVVPHAVLRHFPIFDPLRDDPRFDAILERRRLFEAEADREAEALGPWVL